MKTARVVEFPAKPKSRADRVRALLARRDEADREIAKELREAKDDMGTERWLKWCAREFGWARSTAFARLDPEQIEKHRERQRGRQERVRNLRTASDHNENDTDATRDRGRPSPEAHRARNANGPASESGGLIRLMFEMLEDAAAWTPKDCEKLRFEHVDSATLASGRRTAETLRERLDALIAVLDGLKPASTA
jgi:hypothetical protein